MTDIEKKFERIISENILKKIQDIGIFQTPDGTYGLFGAYCINKVDERSYHLTIDNQHTEYNFYSLKNAVAWCIYDKRNKIVESKRILELDQKLQGVDSSIDLHRHLIKNTSNQEQKMIYFCKLTDEKIKRSSISKELNDYLSESKLYQERRFAENNFQK